MKAWYWIGVLVLANAAALVALLALFVGSGRVRLVSGPAAFGRAADAPLSAAELAYVAKTIERLDAKADPRLIRAVHPALKPARIVPGDVGTLPAAEVVQIHGPADFLGECDGVSLWISGIDTRYTADGRFLALHEHVFYCPGNRTYTTVSGAPRTVMELRAFDATRAKRLGLARLEKEIEKRKRWVVKYQLAGTTSQETPVFTVAGEQLRFRWEWKSTETDRSGSLLVNLHDGQGKSTLLEKCEEPQGTRTLDRGGAFQLAVACFARDYQLWIESRE